MEFDIAKPPLPIMEFSIIFFLFIVVTIVQYFFASLIHLVHHVLSDLRVRVVCRHQDEHPGVELVQPHGDVGQLQGPRRGKDVVWLRG